MNIQRKPGFIYLILILYLCLWILTVDAMDSERRYDVKVDGNVKEDGKQEPDKMYDMREPKALIRTTTTTRGDEQETFDRVDGSEYLQKEVFNNVPTRRVSEAVVKSACKEELYRQTDEITDGLSSTRFLTMFYKSKGDAASAATSRKTIEHLVHYKRQKYGCKAEAIQLRLREDDNLQGNVFIIPTKNEMNENEIREVATAVTFDLASCEIVKDYGEDSIYINNLNFLTIHQDSIALHIENILNYDSNQRFRNIGVHWFLLEVMPSEKVNVLIELSDCDRPPETGDDMLVIVEKDFPLYKIRKIISTLIEWEFYDTKGKSTRSERPRVHKKPSASWVMTAEFSMLTSSL